MKRAIAVLVALVIAVTSEASDLTTRKNILYPPQSSVMLQEDFLSGGTTSGAIGALGFSFGGGTVSGIASIANRPGIFRLDTTAVSGTIFRLLPQSTASFFPGNLAHEVIWITRLNNNDANTTVRIGSLNSFIENPPTRGIYFEKLDGDTNWFCVARESATETRVDSGIAVNTNFTTFLYRLTSSGAVFFIDNVATSCGTIATNLPTNMMSTTLQLINSAAASKTLDVDYFQLKLVGMVR